MPLPPPAPAGPVPRSPHLLAARHHHKPLGQLHRLVPVAHPDQLGVGGLSGVERGILDHLHVKRGAWKLYYVVQAERCGACQERSVYMPPRSRLSSWRAGRREGTRLEPSCCPRLASHGSEHYSCSPPALLTFMGMRPYSPPAWAVFTSPPSWCTMSCRAGGGARQAQLGLRQQPVISTAFHPQRRCCSCPTAHPHARPPARRPRP